MAKTKQKQKQLSTAPTKAKLAKQKEIEKLIVKTKAEQKPKMFANSVYRPQPGYPRQEPRAPINSPTTTALSPQTSEGTNPTRVLVHDTRRAGRALVKDLLPSTSSRPQDGLIAQNEPASLDQAHHGDSLVKIYDGTNFNRKGHFLFMELPGEIRNKIYDLCIPKRPFSITWLKRSKGQPRGLGLCYRLPTDPRRIGEAPKTRPDIQEWRLATRNPKRPNYAQRRRCVMEAIYSQKTPVAMLWVCRAMYPEASSAFYHQCSFSFDQVSSLRFFINNLSAANTRSITSLFIKHQAYGHPCLLANEGWKKKADVAFEDVCKLVAKRCTSLVHLRLDLNYHACPIRFGPVREALHSDFTNQWMVALWDFVDVKLESLRLRVRSDIVDTEVLEVASHELRRELLGNAWDEKKQAGCDPFGYRFVKKGKVLNIVY